MFSMYSPIHTAKSARKQSFTKFYDWGRCFDHSAESQRANLILFLQQENYQPRSPRTWDFMSVLKRAKRKIACDQSLRSRCLWFNDESRRLDAPHRAPDSKSTMQTQAQHTRTGSTSWRVILRIDQSKCHACAIPSKHTHRAECT